MSFEDDNHFALLSEGFRVGPEYHWAPRYLACQAGLSAKERNFPILQKQCRFYLVICLDGAPERIRLQQPWAEECQVRFQEMARTAADQFQRTIFYNLLQFFWRDGFLFGCDDWTGIRNLAFQIGYHCRIENQGIVSWEHQHHPRGGMASTIDDAFYSLDKARGGRLYTFDYSTPHAAGGEPIE